MHAVLSVCYLASVSLSSDFMLYFRLCQNVVAILGLNDSCFRVISSVSLHSPFIRVYIIFAFIRTLYILLVSLMCVPIVTACALVSMKT